MKPIAIAADHAGFALKTQLLRLLPNLQWNDLGPTTDARVDYPDFAAQVAAEVASQKSSFGILICGSGIGMSIAANKVDGIRAALIENPVSARLAREHNDANILCLGSRILAAEYAQEIIQIFLTTPFSGDPRHVGRISKMTQLEAKK
jgi:ribose 5-phosphate isomerase B